MKYRAMMLLASISPIGACGGPNKEKPAPPDVENQAARGATSLGVRAGPIVSTKPEQASVPRLARAPRKFNHPCLMQMGQHLNGPALRAIGTEPFWSARIEGRCITYSHPQDPDGTRIWARYSVHPSGGTWSGAVEGLRFELRTTRRPGCSDGMSDRDYPIAVQLTVGQERRTGCAETL